jgi:hypothetical protein
MEQVRLEVERNHGQGGGSGFGDRGRERERVSSLKSGARGTARNSLSEREERELGRRADVACICEG